MNNLNNRNSLVSIVINCYNGEEFLKKAIDSIYAQTYKNWEIIFWDNASNDSSSVIAKSYDKRLKYYYNTTNISLGKARNKAISVCKGDYICFLDVDDVMLPKKLECQLPLFKNEKVGIVSSQTIFFSEDRILNIGPKSYNVPIGNIFSNLIEEYFLSIDSVLIRKNVFKNILGGYAFNDNFKICEEADMFIRILYKWHFDFFPGALSKRRIHSNNLTKTNRIELINENILLINNLYDLIPNFKNTYKSSINKNKLWILNLKAVYFIQTKKNKEVRALLKNHFLFNLKSCVLFIISFLPKNISCYILSLFKKTYY